MDMPDWLAGWLAGIRMGGDKDKGEYGWVDNMAGAGWLNAQMNMFGLVDRYFWVDGYVLVGG